MCLFREQNGPACRLAVPGAPAAQRPDTSQARPSARIGTRSAHARFHVQKRPAVHSATFPSISCRPSLDSSSARDPTSQVPDPRAACSGLQPAVPSAVVQARSISHPLIFPSRSKSTRTATSHSSSVGRRFPAQLQYPFACSNLTQLTGCSSRSAFAQLHWFPIRSVESQRPASTHRRNAPTVTSVASSQNACTFSVLWADPKWGERPPALPLRTYHSAHAPSEPSCRVLAFPAVYSLGPRPSQSAPWKASRVAPGGPVGRACSRRTPAPK